MAAPRPGLIILGHVLGNDQHPPVVRDVLDDAPGHVLESDEVGV